jgi:hypothetical protein
MVYRKREFREGHGQALMAAFERFLPELREAHDNAPFGSEIFTAVEALSETVRHVQRTLTGDPEYGVMRMHSTHNNPPPKPPYKLRTWKTEPLWKEYRAREEAKKRTE